MSLQRYDKIKGYQESWGCLMIGIILLAVVITALGYWLNP